MNSIYPRLLSMAEKLIESYGSDIKVISYVDVPAANPIDPPVRTESSIDARGVFTAAEDEDIDDTLVLRGDQKVLIAGSLDVENSGTIVREFERWKIIKIQVIKPGPVTILYKAFVRR